MQTSTTGRKHYIDNWDAEDVDAWNGGGADIARRNLIWSIFAEHVGFSVWSIWSVMVLFMPQNVYHIDAAGKFFLVAMPTLVGSILRVPYTFAVAKFGGRNWTIFSASVLLVPTLLTLYFMAHPTTSYTTFMVVAAIAGFGGGNFASSMTNINTFFPEARKGWALGLNAGGGNLGVAVIQLVGLLVLGTAGVLQPRIVLWVFLPLIVLAALGAALWMDNLATARNDTKAMREVVRDGHCWAMSLLYVGTFGSFIGYGFAFGLVLQNQFHRT
ncbi:MAG: MFS transporter, partial [Mycobacteriaceae bacterium]|nr:MFS transporter [Mycobacteriaceae bacterium]